jgi:hypothetical protein
MENVLQLLTVTYPFILAIVALILIIKSVVLVGGRELAVVERRYFGKMMPQGRVIAQANEIGIQARTLGPGLHFLIPFLYAAKKYSFTFIAENEIGLIESIDGDPVPPGKIFAKVVRGHNSFQDGENFLRNGGQKGPQIEILPPGVYRINPVLFAIRKLPAIFIDKGKIGIITAMDGEPIPAGRLLAKKIEGHSAFENGEMFLNNKGQKGPQIEVLLPGTYRINTDLFHVEIHDATVIPANKVGLLPHLTVNRYPMQNMLQNRLPGITIFRTLPNSLAQAVSAARSLMF